LGSIHCINVDEKIDTYNGLLEEKVLKCEVANLPSNLLARIERTLQGLELEQKEQINIESFSHEKTIEETLTKAENELSNIENDMKPYIETLISYTKIIRKIDLLLTSWKIDRKKMLVDRKNLPKESAGEILKETEQKLAEIETRFKEISNVSARSSKILSRISKLGKLQRMRSTDFPTNGIQCSVDEKFLDFVEQTLTALEEKSETLTPSGYSNVRQLVNIRANVHKILQKIPDERTHLIKQLLKLRQLSEEERQSIKLKPEFNAAKNKLLSLRFLVEEVEELRKIEGHMGSIATMVYLEAWVPKKLLKKAVDGMKAATNGKCVIKEEPPAPEDNVPTILKQTPRILEAFEKLTFSFGYPKPGEINPVLIMAVTFPLLFGIMFADVGQGAILLIAGLILTYFRRRVNTEDVGDIIRYLLVGSGLIVLCGVASIFFGFLFGEFFGPSGIIHPITLGKIGPFQIGGFDPMTEPVTMLRFAIFVGVALLSLSVALRIANNLRERQFKHTLISISWLWLLLGGFSLWIYWGGISNMTKWFGEGIYMFIGLIVMPVLVMGVTTAATESVMGGIQFSIEILIESLDHTISFGRLAALALTHSALNYMFLILGGSGHSYLSLQSIPIVLVGTILALTIEGLIIFVHTLRLHWVEWLPGFFSGKGIPFKPLRLNKDAKEHATYGS
jgi:vacuolar-type H+-ATPase subunit I/STV1